MNQKPDLLFDNETLAYTNNTEYRAALRSFFRMNSQISEIPADCPIENLDSETVDELLYDTEAAMKGIQAIYDATKDHPMFRCLYIRAAERMFSEDKMIGLTLLFCYDHFANFVPVLADIWNEKNEGCVVRDTARKYQTFYYSI